MLDPWGDLQLALAPRRRGAELQNRPPDWNCLPRVRTCALRLPIRTDVALRYWHGNNECAYGCLTAGRPVRGKIVCLLLQLSCHTCAEIRRRGVLTAALERLQGCCGPFGGPVSEAGCLEPRSGHGRGLQQI